MTSQYQTHNLALEKYAAMKAADEAFQGELERVYGAANCSDGRYKLRHADTRLQAAKDAYLDAADAWHNATAAS